MGIPPKYIIGCFNTGKRPGCLVIRFWLYFRIPTLGLSPNDFQQVVYSGWFEPIPRCSSGWPSFGLLSLFKPHTTPRASTPSSGGNSDSAPACSKLYRDGRYWDPWRITLGDLGGQPNFDQDLKKTYLRRIDSFISLESFGYEYVNSEKISEAAKCLGLVRFVFH